MEEQDEEASGDVESRPAAHNDRLDAPLLCKPSRAPAGEQHSNVEAGKAASESLDYELIENELFGQDWRARTEREILLYVVLKWTFVFVVGLLTGLVGFGMNMAVENIAGLKFIWTSALMQSRGFLSAFVIYAGSNVVLSLCSVLLVVYVSPAAGGSGIAEVKAYLNGIDTPRIFSLETLFVKVFGSVGAVAGGLMVGKQGPLVHIGSCIASVVGQGGSRKYHLPWRGLRFFKNDRDRRDLVTCGAAAGVAAAFRAPVGGVLFALEEITSWWRSPLLWRSFFTTAVVAVVLRTGIAWCRNGHCGLAGLGEFIIFDTSGVDSDYGLAELFPVILLGVIGGVLGSLFNQLNSKVVVFFGKLLDGKRPWLRIVQVCVLALITSVCSFGLPFLAECTPCQDRSGKDSSSFHCPADIEAENVNKDPYCSEGFYNDLATLLFNTNDGATRNLLSLGTRGEFRMSSLAIYLAISYTLALLTYGISVPSGLFVPSILCGATYGRLVGMMMTTFGGRNLDEGVYALLGSASLLGGSMRKTVSLCIILLELTNNLSMLPLVMLVLLVSKTVGDFFNEGVFNLHVRLKGMPFLDAHPEPFMRRLSAADAIANRLVLFNVMERVSTVVAVLKTTGHNAFAIVDDGGAVFYGLALRSHIMVLLEKKEFLLTADSPSDAIRVACADFAKPASGDSGQPKEVTDLDITAAELDMYIDLRLVTNTSPYTVLETMSLAKAFTLFRQLGLRHLCVISRTQKGSPIMGLLTRHDFMPEYLRSINPQLMAITSSALSKPRPSWRSWRPAS